MLLGRSAATILLYKGVGLIEHGVIKAQEYRDIRRQKFKKMSQVTGKQATPISTLRFGEESNKWPHKHKNTATNKVQNREKGPK